MESSQNFRSITRVADQTTISKRLMTKIGALRLFTALNPSTIVKSLQLH